MTKYVVRMKTKYVLIIDGNVISKRDSSTLVEPHIEFMGSYDDCVDFINTIILNSMKNTIKSNKLDNFTISYEFENKENVTISEHYIDEIVDKYFSVNYQIHLWNWQTN